MIVRDSWLPPRGVGRSLNKFSLSTHKSCWSQLFNSQLLIFIFSSLSYSLSFLFSLTFPLFFLSFSLHKFNFTHGCNRDIYFLPPLWSSLFFLLLYTVQLQTWSGCNRDIYFLLLSGFLFSFFKHRLYSQCTNFLASSVINNLIYFLKFGVNEQKYTSLYFLSGVAYDELDKFHHYQYESHLSVHKLSALRFRALLFQRQDSN
ncbi:unnamed protein product [Acanthosepion pharaonis]|uniref:Uncharacterized protein n=1 Tax=Acanthosepion pharaonis TaxID=158019 RepID=A0A812CQT1_ACAPH|nr:unnamed protein product [Sepia pharaonis]